GRGRGGRPGGGPAATLSGTCRPSWTRAPTRPASCCGCPTGAATVVRCVGLPMTKRKHGRKQIDTWEFKTRGMKSSARVYLVKAEREFASSSQKTHFEVEVDRIPETFWGENLDQLRAEITEALRLRLGIKWQRMLYVVAMGS